MANTATRLSANGSLTITGSFDEVTYNPTSNVVVNLLNYTQDYSNAYWNNRLTISSTSDLAPDNSYSATIFTYNLQFALIQLNPSNYFQNTFGKTYTFSVYAKTTATYIALVTNSNFCNFNLDTGLADNPNFGTSKISKEANGFYRCSVTFTSTVSQNEIFAVWLGGFNGSAFPGKTVTLWGEQVELGTTLSPYQPRDATNILASNTASKLLNSSSNNSTLYIKSEFDEVTYNPNNIGPTRNLFPLSEDFTQQFVWTGSGTLTKNAGISPDGYNNAILYTGTGLYPRIQYFPEVTYGAGFGTPGKYYTHSIFVKYVSQQVCTLVTESWPGYGGNIQYDLFNGTTTGLNASITNATITKYPNNWWRITATYLVPSIPYFSWTPQWRLGYYNGTDYSGQQMLVWGAQMEEGNTATPYLATGYPKNLLTNTNFTTNEWYKENVTLSPNATIGPNGDYTGSLLSSTITGGTNTAFIQQYLYYFPQNTDFTYSVYLKPGTSPTTQLNFYNIAPFSELNTLITWPTITGNYPTLTNSGGATRLATTVTQAANGWWRFSISMNNGLASGLMWRVYTTTNSTTNVNGYSVYIWGPQLEFGLTPTTYIPNTGIFRNILPLANTNMVMKTAGTGNNYIKSTYDEVTGNLPVTDGLILYMDPMKLECYPESGNTAYDLSSSKNIITLNNVTYDKNGYFVYDGFSSWANTTYTQPAYKGTDTFTWNIWFIPTRITTEIIIGNRYYFGSVDNLQFVKLTSIGWEYYDSAGQQGVQSGNTYGTPNVWQNVTMVKNGPTLSYYKNGVFILSSTVTVNMTVTNPFYIGGVGEYFKGSIGIVNVYNRALSVQEISDNFNAFRSRYGI